MTNKIGYFHLPYEQINRAIAEPASEIAIGLSCLFGQVLVVEAVQRWDTRTIRYLGYCAQFAEVPDCTVAPVYEVEMKRIESVSGGCLVVTFLPAFTPSK